MHFQDEEDRELDPDRYLKWAHGFMVVYSITSRATYDAARNYLEMLMQHQRELGREIPVALVGNKMDLERYRWTFLLLFLSKQVIG